MPKLIRKSLFSLILLISSASAEAQTVQSFHASAQAGNNLAYSVSVDARGNVVTAGISNATVNTINVAGSLTLRKFNPGLEPQWTKVFNGRVFPGEVLAGSDGDIYVTGSFEDSLRFSDSLIFRSEPFVNVLFLARFDANGELRWARSIADSQGLGSGGYALAQDKEGNVYVSGNTGATIFYAKFNREGNEILRRVAQTSTHSNASGLDVDEDGNVYIAGYFLGWARFGEIRLDEPYGYFLAKYNAAGEVQWAKAYGDAATSIFNVKLKLDRDRNIYWSAFMMATVDFGTGKISPSNFAFDYLIARHDNSGNFLWARHLPDTAKLAGLLPGHGNYLSVDSAGNAYLGGAFRGRIAFSDNAIVETSYQKRDALLLKYTPAGDVQTAVQSYSGAGSTSSRENIINGLVVANGKIYVAGTFFSDTLSLGSYSAVNASKAEADDFLAVLGDAVSGLPGEDETVLALFPNPASGSLRIPPELVNGTIRIYDLHGRRVFETVIGSENLPLPVLTPGSYFVRIEAGGKNYHTCIRIVNE